MYDFLAYASVTLLMVVSVLLIFIVLLQRGRGGGLAGALGGAGGQSALGTKAGDVFTKITIGLATIWILSACLSIYALRWAVESATAGFSDDKEPTATESAEPGVSSGGDETPATDTNPGAGDVDAGAATESPFAVPPTGSEAGTESTSTGESAESDESVEGPALVPPESSKSESATPADSTSGEK